MAGDSPEEDILVALGSSGIGCADKVFPATQARVATGYALQWIRAQVCELSMDPPSDFHCSKLSAETLFLASSPKTMALSGQQYNWNASAASSVADRTLPMFFLLVIGFVFGFSKLRRTNGTSPQRVFNFELGPKQQVSYGSIDC